MGLQEGYLPDSGPAGAGAPDEGDVALVAPVENFFYCRFAYHLENGWLLQALSEPMIPATGFREGKAHLRTD